jgi:hypothetical protein
MVTVTVVFPATALTSP